MDLHISFDHGVGDCVQFARLMQLYRRRGYKVRVHYAANKEPIWHAAGIESWPRDCLRHEWPYTAEFDHPDPFREGSGNKVFANLNVAPLPDLGSPEEQWAELAAVDMEGCFDSFITPAIRVEVKHFLHDLSRPLVLLHTRGTTFSDQKSLPEDTAIELYRCLLDGMAGTIILLDWDNRVPAPPHGRIRHLRRDWRSISLTELAALMSESDLLIGVDSGPWHLTNMTRCPALGVFLDFAPWSVSLPRPSGRSAVLTGEHRRDCTVHRRRLWNPIEFPSPRPSAQHIATHALRMLDGPRYGMPVGRDAMLQHLVRDRTRSRTSTSSIADRNNTLDALFRMLKQFPNPEIVETGCVRAAEDWSAGYFGYLAGAWIFGRGAGRVTSVDIDPGHVQTARHLCRDWPTEVICSDSLAYLARRAERIDLLYLDSVDCEVPHHAQHALKEIQAADGLLQPGSIVVVDDTIWSGGWSGKGALAVPWAMQHGYEIAACWYQTILVKRPR